MNGACLYLLGTSYQPPRVGYGALRTEENQQPQSQGGGYGQPQSHQHNSQRYKGGRGERTLLPTPPTLPTSEVPADHEGRPYDKSLAARGRKRKRMSRWEPHEEQRGEWCLGGGVGICLEKEHPLFNGTTQSLAHATPGPTLHSPALHSPALHQPSLLCCSTSPRPGLPGTAAAPTPQTGGGGGGQNPAPLTSPSTTGRKVSGSVAAQN